MSSESKIHPVYSNYIIYKDGRVFSLKYQKFIGFKDKDGYVTITVGNKYRRKAYQLVMDVWGKQPPKNMSNPTIDHIDGDINNNHINNLQWLSRSDNLIKSHKSNPRLGMKHGRSKLSNKDILQIRKLYATNKYTLASLGRKYNVSYQHIKRIVSNKQWKHI